MAVKPSPSISSTSHGYALSKASCIYKLLSQVSVFVIFVVSACTPAVLTPTATPSPVSLTATHALPTATAVPPTATLIPPTATLIPTADFPPEALVGTWTRADPERGQLYLTFTKTGGYLAAHGEPGGVVHAGSYTLEGRVLTFVDGWRDCKTGSFVLKITPAKSMFLDELEDATCRDDRVDAIAKRRWNWYIP